jgi:hypothetical protein
MSGDRNRPRRNPVGREFVILALIGIAVIRGGQISSSAGTLVTGTLDASGPESPRVTAEYLEAGHRIRSMGRELDPYNYGRYRNLAQAYGIPYE